MNRPIPRRFRGEPEIERKRNRSFSLIDFLKGFRLPGLFILIGILTVAIFHFLGGETQAKPITPEIQLSSLDVKCRLCGEIKRDESLYISLTNAGMTPRIVYDINCAFDGVFDPKKIMPGDRYTIDTDNEGKLVEFELERSPWEHYRIKRQCDTLLGVKDTIPLTYVIKAAKGEVSNTLWESMVNKGIPAEVILRFTDILSFNVDFLTETRDGQRFALLYEEYIFHGDVIKVGRVVAAEYWISDTSYGGIYYMDPDSVSGYYTLSGKNTKKALLKTPLTYRRISSYFSKSRFHPILKIYRPHLGVDYAAPSGTPVSASGSGVVTFAGWKGGYGNFIQIKHEGNIVTMYGHLKGFAGGIKKGVRVKQGQLIGYVGTTGLSTGPHLDYRVKVRGDFVNPLRYAFPDGPPVKNKYISDFKEKAVDYIGLLEALTENNFAVRTQ
ncbi:M23 family metallopeptidase [bacterium]|nr:M23 family metallopeptidase [bacterium]